MALTVRDLVRRIADGVTTALGPAGWIESRHAPELLAMDTREQRHLAFSVAVPSTVPAALDRQNTRGGARARGTVAESEVVVRWGYQLRPDGAALDYGDALDAEAALVAALLDLDGNPDMSVRVTGLRRTSVQEEGDEVAAVEGQVTLACLHQLPLA